MLVMIKLSALESVSRKMGGRLGLAAAVVVVSKAGRTKLSVLESMSREIGAKLRVAVEPLVVIVLRLLYFPEQDAQRLLNE